MTLKLEDVAEETGAAGLAGEGHAGGERARLGTFDNDSVALLSENHPVFGVLERGYFGAQSNEEGDDLGLAMGVSESGEEDLRVLSESIKQISGS